MAVTDLSSELSGIWEHRPGVVVLLVLGFLIFLFLVVDAWRHKRHKKR